MFKYKSYSLDPLKGNDYESKWKRITPQAQISTSKEYETIFETNSGAI